MNKKSYVIEVKQLNNGFTVSILDRVSYNSDETIHSTAEDAFKHIKGKLEFIQSQLCLPIPTGDKIPF